MRCPFCDYEDTSVIETRVQNNDNALRRRRQCEKCQKRFTTHERIESEEIRVIKKDGRKERFEYDKLKRGMLKALEKRNVPEDKIEESVNSIVRKIRQSEMTEIPSTDIGIMVMRELKSLDKVAYVRFASVYKDFAGIEEFLLEVRKV
ncbi:MAG: transcriptional regulator NrdR, partial [Candidatus Woesearchaeota archaeon]